MSDSSAAAAEQLRAGWHRLSIWVSSRADRFFMCQLRATGRKRRSCQAAYSTHTTSLPPHSAGQSKSQGQPRFNQRGNRPHLDRGAAHRSMGGTGGGCIWKQTTTLIYTHTHTHTHTHKYIIQCPESDS